MTGRLRSLWRVLTARQKFENNMSEELRFHMAEHVEELVRAGMSRDEATRQARLEFGGLNSVGEECRRSRGLFLSDELRRQLTYSIRVLRKAPAFTATALLTIALCLGANLAIFAVIDSVLLRPLPFPQADHLVTLYNSYPKANVERDGSSITNYYERRGKIAAFRSLSIYYFGNSITGEPGFAQREPVAGVSPEFFATLGVRLAAGRTFEEGETEVGRDSVVIVTDAYRRQHWKSNREALGQSIRMDGSLKKVVGVLPTGFRFLSSQARMYLPLVSGLERRKPSERHSGGNVIQMVARLKNGATLAQAQAQIDAQNTALEADDPQAKMMADAGFRTLVVSLHGDHVASIRPTLLLLQAGVLLLLFIGCANLANLHLVRAGTRVREIAVRRALGASGGYVVSELVAEMMVLTLTGSVFGILLGAAGVRLLAILGAERLPLGAEIAFNGKLALLALAVAVGMGIFLAAPAAWLGMRPQLNDALKSEGRGGTGGPVAQRLRKGFLAAQVAFAFVLLVGAGLLGVSLKRALAVPPGFVAEHAVTAHVSLVGNKYPAPATGLLFTERLIDELLRQPGVLSAGIANNIPFSGYSGKSAAAVKGYVMRRGDSPRGHYSYGVAGDYFWAMGFSLKAGRFLTGADSRRRERVCVVDEDFARYYWPQANPLGRQLFQGSAAGPDSEAFTVVGVVGRVKQAGLTDRAEQGAVYYPYIYRPDSNLFVVVRSNAGLATQSLERTLETAVRHVDPELAVTDKLPMDVRIADSLTERRSPVILGSLFSGIALLLTAIGTYGVVSYSVAQRRREIGIRIALGARPQQIWWHFLSMAAALLATGMAIGLAGVLLAGKAIESVLFDVHAYDVSTLAAAAAVIALVSLTACLIPARQASRISPTEALGEN